VVTTRVTGSEVYMPMNSVLEPVNRLTSSCTDKVTHTPAYKEASVRLTVLDQTGADPLPRTNPRHGHPTPRKGAEVERKWVRSDYHPPGNRLVQIETRAAAYAGQEK
jgi:formate dehydrogenase major subunit